MVASSRCSSQSSISTASPSSSSAAADSAINVVVLGAPGVGKTAICVRYLTRRYIGEYCSSGDMNYDHTTVLDGLRTDVHILDTCRCTATGCLETHIRWSSSFLVVYSVCDRHSFTAASCLLQLIGRLKLPGCYTTVLLANKRDLGHCRQVDTEEGHELSLSHGCPFYEVSAADSSAGVSLAFLTLLKESRQLQLLRLLPARRKSGSSSVSRVLGNIFGKNAKYRKKRPSLSI